MFELRSELQKFFFSPPNFKSFFSLWTSNLFFFTNRKSQININLFKGRWKIPMTWICNTFLEKNFLSKTICFIQKQQNSFQIQPFQKTFVNTHWNCVPYSWNWPKSMLRNYFASSFFLIHQQKKLKIRMWLNVLRRKVFAPNFEVRDTIFEFVFQEKRLKVLYLNSKFWCKMGHFFSIKFRRHIVELFILKKKHPMKRKQPWRLSRHNGSI